MLTRRSSCGCATEDCTRKDRLYEALDRVLESPLEHPGALELGDEALWQEIEPHAYAFTVALGDGFVATYVASHDRDGRRSVQVTTLIDLLREKVDSGGSIAPFDATELGMV